MSCSFKYGFTYFCLMLSQLLNKMPNGLRADVKKITPEKNALIICQGALPEFIYLVKKGTVKVFHTNERGEQFLFGLFGQDEIFGELEYFTGVNYLCSVKTITACEIMQFPKNLFEVILREAPGIYEEICSSLAARLLRISQRTTDSSYYPLEFLLAKFFFNETKDNNSTEIQIEKENLSAYFGANIRSINRVIKQFVDAGIVSLNRKQLTIKNIKKLEQIIKSY